MGKLFVDYPGLIARRVSAPGREMIGIGLFAADYFSPGEVVLKLDWRDTSRVKIVAWEETDEEYQDRATAIAPRWYFCANEHHPFWFLDHSCHPNMSYRNWAECEDGSAVTLVACRPIRPGDELTIDYSTMTTSDDGEEEAQRGRWSACAGRTIAAGC